MENLIHVLDAALDGLRLSGVCVSAATGREEFGPNGFPVVGTEFLPGNFFAGLPLNGDANSGRQRGITVGIIRQVADGCPHVRRELFPGLWREIEEEFFELHDTITSNNERSVNII